MLKFKPANAKLKRLQKALTAEYGRKPKIYGLSLPAGHSCPFAVGCLSKADKVTGKLTDGADMEFRCFEASIEAWSPSLRRLVWENFETLRQHKNAEAIADCLQDSMPQDADIIRPGIDGDFYSQAYFDAWLIIARNNPTIRFYAYTKSLGYWVARLGQIPANLTLNASRGGRLDHLIAEHGLKSATVVLHPSIADAMGLEIDHNETHAIGGSEDFALLIHGQQPKGSKASQALKTLKTEGVEYAYSTK